MKLNITEHKDELMEDFIAAIDRFIDSINLIKEKNIQLDKSFYQRQLLMQQIKSDIKNGKIKYDFI